ncbi:DUF6704 family protein [Canibacter zhoujuaniae]|uniref:DUF6704 family protein n=1 Tax=Canibacter zhoujuaniae TaxID=2708343 RepID=UPI00142051B6|nr:DUF6704 family protein [Canibacter zhoujuaniae]
MNNPINDPGHGDSPAAWTAVIIILLAFVAGAFFFFFDKPVAVFICAGVAAFGLLLGFILSKAGYGVNGPKYTPKGH